MPTPGSSPLDAIDAPAVGEKRVGRPCLASGWGGLPHPYVLRKVTVVQGQELPGMNPESPRQPYIPQPRPYPPPVVVPPTQAQTVARSGISGSGLAVHITLTCLTFWACGGWGWVWFFHWLFTRNKTVTTTNTQTSYLPTERSQRPW